MTTRPRLALTVQFDVDAAPLPRRPTLRRWATAALERDLQVTLRFVGAREAFIVAATTEPRAPDAWANLGTASWAAADTARSVAAWQRALRLEPLASDVRDRVELVHTCLNSD